MTTYDGPRPTKTTTPNYVSIQAAADLFEVSPRTIRRMIGRGELTGYRLGPRAIRIDLNELAGLLRPIPTSGGFDVR